jgi:hypothetical protein
VGDGRTVNSGTGGPPISRAGITYALERLRTNRDSISAALLDLENHPGHRLLDGADVTGVTLERWERARARLKVVWKWFDRYTDALSRAEALRASDPRPGSADAAELDRLLTGDAVEMAGAEIPLEHRGLLGPARQREMISLDELVRRMNEAFTEAAEIVVAVDEAWTRLLPALGHAEEAGRAVRERLTSLGQVTSDPAGTADPPAPSGESLTSGDSWSSGESLTSGGPAPTESLGRFSTSNPSLSPVPVPPPSGSSGGPSGSPGPDRPTPPPRPVTRDRAHRERTAGERSLRELADLGHAARTDPLSFVRAGEADPAELERIASDLRGCRRELDGALRVREEYGTRSAALVALIDRVAAAQAEALRARERVLVRITSPTLPDVPDLTASLRDRLASLAELRRQERWVDLAKRATVLEAVAADALDEMSATLGAIMAPLHRRDELRGRLEAYAAKAVRLGHAEDDEMTRLREQARELLWTAPCDLRAAAAAVRAYQEVIGRRQRRE